VSCFSECCTKLPPTRPICSYCKMIWLLGRTSPYYCLHNSDSSFVVWTNSLLRIPTADSWTMTGQLSISTRPFLVNQPTSIFCANLYMLRRTPETEKKPHPNRKVFPRFLGLSLRTSVFHLSQRLTPFFLIYRRLWLH
jgi:hypothetical protein